ncbi:MAG: hypothetical protein FWC95_03380 [Defluviitaleaceae bacterium]|nr:hypothetical protein [Defluviitaleaceae bacterium]
MKNISILLLIALCIVQAGRLWFGGVPRLDFLYILGIERSPVGLTEAMDSLAVPRRMLISVGEQRFVATYTSVAEAPQYIAASSILREVMRMDIAPVIYSDFDVPSILTEPYNGDVVVFDYGFAMPAAAFFAAKQEPNRLEGYMDEFNMIIFISDRIEADEGYPYGSTRIFFINTFLLQHTIVEFITEQYVCLASSSFEHDWQNLFYVPSLTGGSPMFLPRSFFQEATFRQIQITSNYTLSGDGVDGIMRGFFDEPEHVHGSSDPFERNTFRDNFVTAIYFEHINVIEYRNWQTGGRATGTLQEAYALARLFITDRDVTFNNESFLSHFEYEDGRWRLFFNLIYDNLPIMLSDELREILSMDSFIEITIERGRVTHYKRYAVLVHFHQQNFVAGHFIIDYISVFDYIYEYHRVMSINTLQNLFIHYIIEVGGQANLSYAVVFNGKKVFLPLLPIME